MSEFVVHVYLLHRCDSFWGTIAFLRLTALLFGLCIVDFQVLPQGWPLQAARPKHVEGQPLPTTDAATALTTTTSPRLSPLHPHRHHQVVMKKVSLFHEVFLGFFKFLWASVGGVKIKLANKMKSCGLGLERWLSG